MNKLESRLLGLYQLGREAGASERYKVWRFPKNEQDDYMPLHAEGLFAEIGFSWAEVAEVAWYHNMLGDGMLYYVGSQDQGTVLRPRFSEAKEIMDYAKSGSVLTHEEKMVLLLTYGGDWFEVA